MIQRAAEILLPLLLAAACGRSLHSQTTELVLGAIYPLSGPQTAGGEQELAGVQAVRAAAVVSRWQSVGVMKVVFPPAYVNQ